MNLTNRQNAILLGVLRDRDRLAPQTHSGHGLGIQRRRTDNARSGFVELNPAAWLGHEATPSQSTMNSRAYRKLTTLGLIERHNFHGERKTTHLKLTSTGETIARRLRDEGDSGQTS